MLLEKIYRTLYDQPKEDQGQRFNLKMVKARGLDAGMNKMYPDSAVARGDLWETVKEHTRT